IDSSFLDRLIFNLIVLNPFNRSLKLEYKLDDNSFFMSLYDLDINSSDTKREYVTFWNPIININIYGQITRKYLYIEIVNIRQFNLITNDMISNNNLSVRTFEKVSNYTLWKTIKYIVDQSNLSVTLIKVKGHSGDIYNNIADDLAKSETQSPEISINYLKVLSIKCLFQFNDIIIESSVKHFTKNIFTATAVSNIIDLHRNDDFKSLTKQAKVYWTTIWSIFTLDQATYSTSFSNANSVSS
ncbi:15500_t:CDS:2, partial [Funneliformis geosporum]